MDLQSAKKRIEAYLASAKRWPIVVDFVNCSDMRDFVEHFSVGENSILSAGHFCGKDGTMKFEELSNSIEANNGDVFLTNLAAFIKLQGDIEAGKMLKNLLSKAVSGHVVLVTYRCRDYLNYSDIRFSERNQILLVAGEPDEEKHICFIGTDLKDAFPGCYCGFENLGQAYEYGDGDTVYVATDIDRRVFLKSALNIAQLSNGYEILCSRDPLIQSISVGSGTEKQWNYLLKNMGTRSFAEAVDRLLGAAADPADSIKEYVSFTDELKWIFYLALTVWGSKKNSYLQLAAQASANYKELPRALFRTLLTVDSSAPNFRKLYNERKTILGAFTDSVSDVMDYCKVVAVKEEEAVFYLTDLTRPEKEKVIDWLDTYGEHYTAAELQGILENIYPDLAAYLNGYRFKKPLLEQYFDDYKYQKVINRILPHFEVVVDDQAEALDFVSILQPRTSIVDKLDFSNAHGYFVDALGAEYLGYIQTKCNTLGLSANIAVGRCELPSLTSYNKEFLETFTVHGCPVSDIKTLDEIKHHGEDSFDYEKVKKPVYLVRELEIIDELLKKIRANILSGLYEKAIVISDHGASRLAVLHETENMWSMATKGVHSGRCCPKNDVDTKPDNAIDGGDYWVLANYDRFKGGRKANVEVHGGATIEEVTVPIIEITRKPGHVEAFIASGSKVVTIGAKEYPVIKIYVSVKSSSISIQVNDRYYDAVPTAENYIYMVDLPDLTKKGIYTFNILNGADVLSSQNTFEVKKKGMAVSNLFD